MSKFSKGQSIYPSELSEAGTVTMQVLGPSFRSKWPNKRTKKPVFSVKVDIEGEEKYLNFDEQDQAKAFDRWDGQTVDVLFDGTDVKITGKGGVTSASSQPAATMEDVDGLATQVQNMQQFCEEKCLEQTLAFNKVNKLEFDPHNFGGKVSAMFRILEKNSALAAFPADQIMFGESSPE